jgi:serine/threonine-protein kinase RsbW
MTADPERGATAPRSIRRDGPRWAHHASAVSANVSPMRRALVAFAADHGADLETQHAIALVASEAITNTVIHAFVGTAPGRVSIDATVADDRLHATITDDGHGMRPRPDSPGLGLGLPVIARLAASASITPGPGGRGTTVSLEFPLA